MHLIKSLKYYLFNDFVQFCCSDIGIETWRCRRYDFSDTDLFREYIFYHNCYSKFLINLQTYDRSTVVKKTWANVYWFNRNKQCYI